MFPCRLNWDCYPEFGGSTSADVRMNNDLENRTRETSTPLYEAKGWLKFLGFLCLLQAIWMAASIVGLIVAWLPLWLGILLLQSASAVEKAHRNADQEALIRSLQKLRTCFTLMGCVLLLLVIAVSVFLVAVLTGGLAGTQWLHQ